MNVKRIFLVGGLALAMSQMVPVLADTAARPHAESDNVPYVSGGVGEDDAIAMKREARNYNLMLTFATRETGSYLADVTVNIVDARGRTALDTVSQGPIFLANVAPGVYTIRAEVAGSKISKTVTVAAGQHAHLVFSWPDDIVT